MGNSCSHAPRASACELSYEGSMHQGENGRTFVKHKNAAYTPNMSKRGVHIGIKQDSELEIITAQDGDCIAGIKPKTLIEIFNHAGTHPTIKNITALRWEGPDTKLDGLATIWDSYTWGEYYEHSRTAARAFMTLGIELHDAVSIIGFNSRHWFISQMGCVLAGGKSAGIYTTNGPADCAHVVNHSESQIVMCENTMYARKFVEAKQMGEEMCRLKYIVVWGDDSGEKFQAVQADASKVGLEVMSWDDFIVKGKHTSEAQLASRGKDVKPGHCAQLIYTSGTTGKPKAVMCSHDSLYFEARSVLNLDLLKNLIDGHHYTVSFLPLSHVAGNMLDVILPLVHTGEEAVPGSTIVTFAKPDALKGSLKFTLEAVQPTVFLAVPRVWEKFQEAIIAKKRDGPKPSFVMEKLVGYAKYVGKEQYDNTLAPESDDGNFDIPGAPFFAGQALANIVHKKVQSALGLNRCAHYCATAAAPIAQSTLDFFGQFGIYVHEAYGMSESAGATSCTDQGQRLQLCVGTPFEGTELMIDHSADRGDRADQGEICFRGRHIMMGYLKDEKKTAECIDADGWLHSGDLGRVDKAGRCFITGRIKELIIGAGGENVAPVPIEDAVKERAPCISNVMVVGDRRKYLTMLVTLKQVMDLDNPDGPMPTDKFMPNVSKDIAGMTAKTPAEANSDAAVQKYVQDAITYWNTKLSVSNATKIQKFRIVNDFSVPGGELTATMKLKRSVVAEKFNSVIEEMYA